MNRREIMKALGLGGIGASSLLRLADSNEAPDPVEGEAIPRDESYDFIVRAYRGGDLVCERPCNLRRTDRKRSIHYGVNEMVTVIYGHDEPLVVDEFRICMTGLGIEKAIPPSLTEPPPYYVGVEDTLSISGGRDGLISVEV